MLSNIKFIFKFPPIFFFIFSPPGHNPIKVHTALSYIIPVPFKPKKSPLF